MDKRFISNLLKGVVATSFGSIITIGFHFLSIMLMTRYVGKEVLGLYFLSMAVVQVLKVISGLGLDLTLTKSVSGGDRDVQHDALASTIAVRLVAVGVVGLIFFAAGRFLLPLFDVRLSDFVGIMIVFFALAGFEELFLNLMQGVHQFKGYAFVQVFSAASRVVLLVLLRERLSLQVLLYIEIVSVLTAFLVQLFLTRGLLLGLSRRNVNARSVRELGRFSAPLYSNTILTMVYDRASVFLIGTLLGPASVAAYEVALKVPDGFMRLFNSFVVVYFPGLSSLFGKGRRGDAQRMMNSSLVLLSVGIGFLVLVAFLFSREIVLVLFSQQYADVWLAFALLMLNFLLRALSNILGYSLVAAGYASAPIKANIVSALVNIAGSLVLIRLLGFSGAVYSLLLMNITSQVIYTLLLKRAGLAPRSLEYLKPFFVLAAALAVYAVAGSSSVVLRLALVVAYVAAVWMAVGETREMMRSTLRRLAGLRKSRKAALATSSEDV